VPGFTDSSIAFILFINAFDLYLIVRDKTPLFKFLNF